MDLFLILCVYQDYDEGVNDEFWWEMLNRRLRNVYFWCTFKQQDVFAPFLLVVSRKIGYLSGNNSLWQQGNY